MRILLRTIVPLAIAMSATLTAQPLDDAIKVLLAKVSKYVEPGPGVRVSSRNSSSLSNAGLAKAQRAFERALRRRAAKAVPTPAVMTEVRLTLAEDVREAVLIAEVVQETQRHVELVRFQPESVERKNLPALERQLEWEQVEPILDIHATETRLLVLDTGKVAVYEKREGKWVQRASVAVASPPVRDPRGRVVLSDAGLDVYLPGATCHGRLEPELEVTCNDQAENFMLAGEPAHFVPGRNALEAAGWRVYYSIARLDTGAQSRLLLAETDGRTRIYDAAHQPLGLVEGLSGDLSGVCGDKVLAVRSPGNGAASSIAAYTLQERKAVAVTEALELPGPVAALWPAVSGAIAIVKNQGTGNYAAYSIHLDCAR